MWINNNFSLGNKSEGKLASFYRRGGKTSEVMLLSLVLLSIVLKEVENEAKKAPDDTRSNRKAEVRMCYGTAEQPHHTE